MSVGRVRRIPNMFDSATLASEQTSDERTLLALKVNGRDLSLDHGFPARVIGPGIPGVHCTKWASDDVQEGLER